MPALYIHIPFCKQKCVYCDFTSYPGLDELHGAYADALLREMRSRAVQLKDRRVPSIYIGGGTPTLLEPAHIGTILAAARESFEVAPNAEITVETNPETVTREKLEAVRAYGVNRVSIGLQSLDDYLLGLLGRKHTAQQAVDALHAAREAGFDNVSIDLIFGIPGQSLAGWALTLEQAASLGPDHISCYGLTVEPGTPLERRIACGALEAPDEDTQADMFAYTMESLLESGYEHYEISNYAMPGKRCRHNLVYWDNEDYLGLGAAAHSKLDHVRSRNVGDPAAYIRTAGTGASFAESIGLSVEDEMSETLFLGLRKTGGISRDEFEQRFGTTLEDVYGAEIEGLIKDGLLIRDSGLRLSRKGILLGNEAFSRFV